MARWRKFLEPPASGTDSYVAVTWDRDVEWPDANLKIADCDRRVQLYFNFKTKAGVRKARKKLDGLREAIDRLEEIVSRYER